MGDSGDSGDSTSYGYSYNGNDGGFGNLQGSLGDGGTLGGVGEADAPTYDSRMGYDGVGGGYGFGGSSSNQPQQLADIFNFGDLQAPQFSAQNEISPFADNLGVRDYGIGSDMHEAWNKYKHLLGPVAQGLGLAAKLTGTALAPQLALPIWAAASFAPRGQQGPAQGYGATQEQAGPPTPQQAFTQRGDSMLNDLLVGNGRFENVNTGKQAIGQLQQQQQQLADLYSPNWAYAKQLEAKLNAKDAASGRRSQYGSRQVQLQAALADAAFRSAGTQRQLTLDQYNAGRQGVADKNLRNQSIVTGVKDAKSLYDLYNSFS